MGDRVTATIVIGGRLPIEKLPDFVKLCNEEDANVDYDTDLTVEEVLETAATGDNLRLGGYQINYGNFPGLETFLREHGMFFCRTWDRGGEFGAGGELVDAEGELDFATDGNHEDPLLSIDRIHALPLLELMRLCDRLSAPVADLVIVGADGPVNLNQEEA